MYNDRLRDRIDMVRFTLICGLVFLHYGYLPGIDVSPFEGPAAGDHFVATFVNAYVLFFFLSAVPLLSCLSGWLFFQRFKPTAQFFLQKYAARARSILLPMVLWNAAILALFVALAAVRPGSYLLDIVRYDVEALNLPALVNALVGVTRHPIDFQFWFLRDLLLTILLSPVLALLLRRAPYAGLAGLALVWLGGATLGIFFRTDVLFFFYLGALARVRGWKVERPVPRLGAVLLALYTVVVAVRTAAPLALGEASADSEALDVATRLIRLLGVAAIWTAAPLLLATPAGRLAAALGPLAFFLHAIHWPLNQFVKDALARVLPTDGNALLLLNYVATTVLTIAIAIAVARVMAWLVPGLFGILSGGRGGVFGRGAEGGGGAPATVTPRRGR
jgi:surface polysaccharide O-acyltransferase-like enzyme